MFSVDKKITFSGYNIRMLEITIDISNIISTDKTLESKSQENKYEDETMDQNKIQNLNDLLDEKIDKSKSFEDQIKSLKGLEDLKEYLPIKSMMIKS